MLFLVFSTSLLLSLLLGCSADPTGTQCPVSAGPSCVCDLPDGSGKIDLSHFSKNGQPGFSSIGPDPNNFLYDYNPCSTFNSENGLCQSAYVCQTPSDNPSHSNQIADAGTEQMWIDTDNTPYAYYTAQDPITGDTRESFVYLNCDQSLKDGQEVITTDGDSVVTLTYVFHLSSCHVCPDGCGSHGGDSGGGGGVAAGIIGIVLIIGVIGGLVTYFIVGAVVMKVNFNAAGSDIIPNKVFWIALPGLIKDGCLFVVSPCLKAARGRQGYQEAK